MRTGLGDAGEFQVPSGVGGRSLPVPPPPRQWGLGGRRWDLKLETRAPGTQARQARWTAQAASCRLTAPGWAELLGWDWLGLAEEGSSGCCKAETPLLRHQSTQVQGTSPLQRLFPSFIRLGSRTVISVLLFPSTGRLEMGEEIAKSRTWLPSLSIAITTIVILDPTIHHRTECLRVYSSVWYTVHNEHQHQHQYPHQSDPIAIRRDFDARQIRYDTMHCPLPWVPPGGDGAPALPASSCKTPGAGCCDGNDGIR